MELEREGGKREKEAESAMCERERECVSERLSTNYGSQLLFGQVFRTRSETKPSRLLSSNFPSSSSSSSSSSYLCYETFAREGFLLSRDWIEREVKVEEEKKKIVARHRSRQIGFR